MSKLSVLFTIICMALAGGSTAMAQATGASAANLLKVKKFEVDTLRSPQYDVSITSYSTKRDGRLNWLQLEAEFETAPDWLDEVTFTFYVALKGDVSDLPRGSKDINVFSGTVTVVNIPKSRHTVDMFLDPYTLARYGKVVAQALVVSVNGQELPPLVEPSSTAARKWWTTETPNAVSLLPRYETPYRLTENDSQLTVKP